jgi:hypothetical protein
MSLNMVAHSYGTTTASLGLAGEDLHVDSFVSLGSAGIPQSVPTADAIHADHVYAGQAQNAIPGLEKGDEWAWRGRDGSGRLNPMDPSFGATTFNTDGVPGDDSLHGITEHATGKKPTGYGYLDLKTESLNNTALATTGHGDNVSPYQNPGYTDLQKTLIRSMEQERSYGY